MATHQQITSPTDRQPVDLVLEPLRRFLHLRAAGGILLLIATAVALGWANSPWAASYHELWHAYVTVGSGEYAVKQSLAHWVNDGLMVVFFFLVGLEIKREVLLGELASFRQAAVPLMAAAGGMALPALAYVALNLGKDTLSGWAVPAATDIAFALGVLALLGDRVPGSLRVFLTAVAIVDDIGAVIIIGLFYTHDLSMGALGAAGGILVLLILMNRLGIRRPAAYALVGVALWLAFLKSGVHATVAGVLLALTVPASHCVKGAEFVGFARQKLDDLVDAGGDKKVPYTRNKLLAPVQELEEACRQVETPLHRMERRLHPWVNYLILPVFALANAGVALDAETVSGLARPVGLGVLLGLILGKQVGVGLMTWAAVKTGIGRMPSGTTPLQIYGASILTGIGFTMSLFIANLAFEEGGSLDAAKIGILTASLVSGIAGLLVIRMGTSRGSAGSPS